MTNSPDFVSALRSFNDQDVESEEQRQTILIELHQLISRLERPVETGVRHAWIQPSVNACLATLSQLDLFTKWAETGPLPLGVDELAKLVAADTVLIRRLLQHLAANHLLRYENSSKTYSMTPFTRSLAKGSPWESLMKFYQDVNAPAFLRTPAYFAEKGYQNPIKEVESIFQFTKGDPLWVHLQKHPDELGAVSSVMKTLTGSLKTLVDDYDASVIVAAHREGPLLVDCGGGVGTDLAAFQKRFPSVAPEQLILEDLPGVIQQARQLGVLAEGTQLLPHDFFQPQPIKHAALYYLHKVLHDWPDLEARQILGNVRDAMAPTSKLLIHEHVLNDPPMAGQTNRDITMMAMQSGRERTIHEWTDLITSSGLTIVQLHGGDLSQDQVIEVVLDA